MRHGIRDGGGIRGGARAARRVAAVAVGLAALAAGTSGCGGSSGTGAGGGASSGGSGYAVSHQVHSHPGPWTKERFEKALSEHGGTSHPARATASNARVGALFENDVSGTHFCTASVVHSSGKNLLVTAAHCVHGGKGGSYKSDLVFVPDYRDGTAPQGQWPVTDIVVDQRWIDSSDADLDVAFVALGQVGGKDIEDVLGGNTLGVDQGFNRVVQITGYPSDAGAPISCVNRTTQQSQYQMRIACTGYPGGTSGSPWLSRFDRTTRTGTVIGVIGGYQQGGDTEDVSYSVYFDSDVRNLYDRAAGSS
ncbi:serine protease [Streptacidiphilus sp. N1-12]|uniref:Serine protease n=2 Tax=Streptacidiphilus alkalitolerans TaxID=3342712 RepID=A0ABV6WPN1_9ACTN